MEHPQPDWPATRWSLTAPESYVLNYAGEGRGLDAFKLALKELVARRALRLEPVETRGRRGPRRERSALSAGPNAAMSAEPSLSPVLALFADADKTTLQATEASTGGMRAIEGVLVEDFAKAARKRFGGFDGYRDQHVVPALVSRGLMTSETRTVFGVFRTRRKGWTDAGREVVDELERWLQVGRARLSDWVSDDPTKALAYTSGAGAAILLMGHAYPEFALLEQHLAERRALPGDGGAGPGDAAVASRDGDDRGGEAAEVSDAYLGGIDLGALGDDFRGLGGLDGAFSAVDSGVDAGGGGDGGGGGGGDGAGA